MRQLSMRDAINEALHLEMARDPRVIVLGEDVSGGAGGTSGQRDAAGGVFGVTKGLLPKFGEDRVIDTPISESAIIGAANGAALAGMRPVAELMFADFLGVCFDQVFNQAAKFRYMFGGQAKPAVVVRMPHGIWRNSAAQHSQTRVALLLLAQGGLEFPLGLLAVTLQPPELGAVLADRRVEPELDAAEDHHHEEHVGRGRVHRQAPLVRGLPPGDGLHVRRERRGEVVGLDAQPARLDDLALDLSELFVGLAG